MKSCYFFRGTSGIDIDLRKVDINQCPTSPQEGDDQIETGTKKYNIFGGTDKCKPETTQVSIFSYKYKKKLLSHFKLERIRYLTK